MTSRTAEIGDFVEVVSGPAFKSAQFTDDPSDVPLIKGENVAQGYIAGHESKYWPANDTENYERFGIRAR
jgi:type I restriction enzyme S subunit